MRGPISKVPIPPFSPAPSHPVEWKRDPDGRALRSMRQRSAHSAAQGRPKVEPAGPNCAGPARAVDRPPSPPPCPGPGRAFPPPAAPVLSPAPVTRAHRFWVVPRRLARFPDTQLTPIQLSKCKFLPCFFRRFPVFFCVCVGVVPPIYPILR